MTLKFLDETRDTLRPSTTTLYGEETAESLFWSRDKLEMSSGENPSPSEWTASVTALSSFWWSPSVRAFSSRPWQLVHTPLGVGAWRIARESKRRGYLELTVVSSHVYGCG